MRKFKLIFFIFLALFLCDIRAYAQKLEHDEVIARCNELIQNIYNDIWLIKDGYKELQNFGSQDIHQTPELPPRYRTIKNIKIENLEARANRQTLFLDDKFNPYIQDEIYICFSDSKKILGIGSEPLLCIYLRPYELYLLFFSTSDNERLKNAITKILTRNARAAVM